MFTCSAILALATAMTSALQLPTSAETPSRSQLPVSGAISLPQSFVEHELGFRMLGKDLAASLETGVMRWLISGTVDGQPRRSLVTIEPVGALPNMAPQGEDLQPGVVSHFSGSKAEWRAARRTYRTVRYSELWPGIELVLEAKGQHLKGCPSRKLSPRDRE